MAQSKINWQGSGYYVLKGGVWQHIGLWSSMEGAQRFTRWTGLSEYPMQFVDSMPDHKRVDTPLVYPKHWVFRAATMIQDRDWDNRIVYKHINVVAPNIEVAREAIALILKNLGDTEHGDQYTGTVEKHVLTRETNEHKRYLSVLMAGFMPFVDNNNVYFRLTHFDLKWERVEKSVKHSV